MTRELAPWTSARVLAAAQDARRRMDELDVIRQKGPRTVLRYDAGEGPTVILKIWETDSWRSRLACKLRAWSVDHEWRGLVRARAIGVRAPRPIGVAHATWSPGVHGGVIVMEDLGELPSAMDFIQECLAAGGDARLAHFEESIVQMTTLMLDGNLLDDDHGILNMVASEQGEAVRLDFERARSVLSRAVRPGLVARTVGFVIATYGYAIDDDAARLDAFSELMRVRVRLRKSVWAAARRYADAKRRAQLEDRRRRAGLGGAS